MEPLAAIHMAIVDPRATSIGGVPQMAKAFIHGSTASYGFFDIGTADAWSRATLVSKRGSRELVASRRVIRPLYLARSEVSVCKLALTLRLYRLSYGKNQMGSPVSPERLAVDSLRWMRVGQVSLMDRPGAGPGTPDIMVVTKSGAVWAVEVTRAMHFDEAKAWASARKKNWQLDGLLRCWTLMVPPDFNATALHTAAARSLPALDRLKVQSFGMTRDPMPAGALPFVRDLYAVGAVWGNSCCPPADGSRPTVSWASARPERAAPAELGAVLQAEVDKPDNRSKLAASDADESHLWVWVENPAVHPALSAGAAFDVGVVLPPIIDVLWAARTLRGDWPLTHLWRFRRGGQWEILVAYGERQ